MYYMSRCSAYFGTTKKKGDRDRREFLWIEKLKNEKSKIKHCIAIVSGKGGVGKSFVTSLIASSLNKLGYKCYSIEGGIDSIKKQ